MSKNYTDIKKAIMTTNNFVDYSLKEPEQMNNFIKKLQEMPTLMNWARVMRMGAESMKIPKIGLNKRFLRSAAEAVQLEDAQYTTAETEVVSLDTVKLMGDFPISFEAIEDNVSEENLMMMLREIVLDRVAYDMADLFWNGDTGSSDTFLNTLDGIFELVTSNTYDFANNPISNTGLSAAFRALPAQYKRNITNMRYILRPEPVYDYNEDNIDRDTAFGDSVLRQGDMNPRYMGIPLIQAPGIATYLNGTDDNSNGLLTFPSNILVGIYRDFTIKLVPDDLREVFVLHVSGRVGVAVEEEEAAVKITNIQHTA